MIAPNIINSFRITLYTLRSTFTPSPHHLGRTLSKRRFRSHSSNWFTNECAHSGPLCMSKIETSTHERSIYVGLFTYALCAQYGEELIWQYVEAATRHHCGAIGDATVCVMAVLWRCLHKMYISIYNLRTNVCVPSSSLSMSIPHWKDNGSMSRTYSLTSDTPNRCAGPLAECVFDVFL